MNKAPKVMFRKISKDRAECFMFCDYKVFYLSFTAAIMTIIDYYYI